MSRAPLSTHRRTIAFKGHLIDSLTLSKIADHIERLNGRYELNDIRIGVHRQDISSINITVFADTDAQLSAILEDLKPYGAVPSGEASVETAPCPQDGAPPEHAFTIRLPQQVCLDGQWVPVQAGNALTLVIDDSGKPKLRELSEVRQGERVVVGNLGIEW